MTPEQTIELAKQAGFTDHRALAQFEDELQLFAELVGNAKLEEAAKRLEQVAGVWLTPSQAAVSAKEIRSMKK